MARLLACALLIACAPRRGESQATVARGLGVLEIPVDDSGECAPPATALPSSSLPGIVAGAMVRFGHAPGRTRVLSVLLDSSGLVRQYADQAVAVSRNGELVSELVTARLSELGAVEGVRTERSVASHDARREQSRTLSTAEGAALQRVAEWTRARCIVGSAQPR